MHKVDRESLKEKMGMYTWYHTIEVADGIYTESFVPNFKKMWDHNLKCMEGVDFTDKKVLDIGCRDGLFSFEAEKRGAREIIGIDNDISKGAVEFLIPFFNSKVKMYEASLYDLNTLKFGTFDIILFFGVLYHLRYPFWGLKKVIESLSDNGLLLIESGMLITQKLKDKEILYCPVENSPYNEPTSCTFFNKEGLGVTMDSLGCRLLEFWTLDENDVEHKKKMTKAQYVIQTLKMSTTFCRSKIKNLFFGNICDDWQIKRQFYIFKKEPEKRNYRGMNTNVMSEYWNGTHKIHSKKSIIYK